MPKWEALRSKNKHFALYVWQNNSFRRFMKYKERVDPRWEAYRIVFPAELKVAHSSWRASVGEAAYAIVFVAA